MLIPEKTSLLPWETWFGNNAEQRNQNVLTAAGLLERWIDLLLRQGLARIANADQEHIAVSLTDLQVIEMAHRVRNLSFEGTSPESWEALLEELSLLKLWCRAVRKYDQPDMMGIALRHWAGVVIRKEKVLEHGKRQKGTWHVWGIREELTSNGLRAQRTWFQETRSQTWAMLLNYLVAEGKATEKWTVGQSYDLTMAFYPSSLPLRTVVAEDDEENAFVPTPQLLPDTESILTEFSRALGKWAWLEVWPTGWDQVRIFPPQSEADQWLAVDTISEDALPIKLPNNKIWQLFAFTAGEPVQLFGEWNGQNFFPLCAKNPRQELWIF